MIKLRVEVNHDKLTINFNKILGKIINKYGKNKTMEEIGKAASIFERIQLWACRRYFLGKEA